MKLIILDRDGVINHDSDDFIKSPNEWIPIPQSLAAIARLKQAQYSIAVATNQSGVGRGLYSIDTLEQIHEKMQAALQAQGGEIDYLVYCPHHPDDNCDCRKPKTGLYLKIAKQFNVPLANVPMIGDSWRDIQAARSVGGRPILVLTGYGQKTFSEHKSELRDIEIFPSLYEAVMKLIEETILE